MEVDQHHTFKLVFPFATNDRNYCIFTAHKNVVRFIFSDKSIAGEESWLKTMTSKKKKFANMDKTSGTVLLAIIAQIGARNQCRIMVQ